MGVLLYIFRTPILIIITPNYLFNYITQSYFCIIEIFNRAFLKNNIETKDDCKFDEIVREIICEFQQACKYVHQIENSKITVGNELKIRLLIKEDPGWYGRANFVGKLFDSVVRDVSEIFKGLSSLL